MKRAPKKMTRDQKEKLAAKILESDGQQQDWKDDRLGRDMKHAERAGSMPGNTYPTSIRLPVALVRALRQLAALEGISYEAYLKMILARHVRAHAKAE